MSRLDYSKWNNIEISDDSDEECHPNIDKASWQRWRQQDIHRKREERKIKIAGLKQEHKTNQELRKRLEKSIQEMKTGGVAAAETHAKHLLQSVYTFETERKEAIMNPDSPDYLKPRDEDEIYAMLLSRLLKEEKVEPSLAAYLDRLPQILVNELPKLDKRQQEVLDSIAAEEKEQTKKLTSDNICQEGFNKTVLNGKTTHERGKTTAKSSKKTQKVELLNEGFEKHAHPPASSDKPDSEEGGLDELSSEEQQLLVDFSNMPDYEKSYAFIQRHPEIVSREMSDHLMARAFSLQMKGNSDMAYKCAKWSLAISYSMQMGTDGVGLFYKRLISGGSQPVVMFENDVERTFNHIKERCKILKAKQETTELNEENSNLTPEQAAVFKTFPKHFQDALVSNDIEKLNESLQVMGEEKANEVMEKCKQVGLIAVLSDEEAKMYTEKEQQQQEGEVA